uniref:Uncharacterized protein n=1 Tax=Knipowitschia caucasica TaxID=637954 RepID=A0AAV2KUM8_KNICA
MSPPLRMATPANHLKNSSYLSPCPSSVHPPTVRPNTSPTSNLPLWIPPSRPAPSHGRRQTSSYNLTDSTNTHNTVSALTCSPPGSALVHIRQKPTPPDSSPASSQNLPSPASPLLISLFPVLFPHSSSHALVPLPHIALSTFPVLSRTLLPFPLSRNTPGPISLLRGLWGGGVFRILPRSALPVPPIARTDTRSLPPLSHYHLNHHTPNPSPLAHPSLRGSSLPLLSLLSHSVPFSLWVLPSLPFLRANHPSPPKNVLSRYHVTTSAPLPNSPAPPSHRYLPSPRGPLPLSHPSGLSFTSIPSFPSPFLLTLSPSTFSSPPSHSARLFISASLVSSRLALLILPPTAPHRPHPRPVPTPFLFPPSTSITSRTQLLFSTDYHTLYHFLPTSSSLHSSHRQRHPHTARSPPPPLLPLSPPIP